MPRNELSWGDYARYGKAVAGSIYQSGLSSGARSGLGHGAGFLGSAPKRRKTSKAHTKRRGRSSGRTSRGGIGRGQRVKTKSRRHSVKKKSLKKRVSKLERDGPKDSKVWALETALYVAENSTICNTSYYQFPMIQKSIIESTTNEVTGNAGQTQCKVTNQRATLLMKNNCTSNCDIEYQFYKCTGNTEEDVLTGLRTSLELYAKFGTPIASLPILTGPGVHTATASRTPRQLALGGTEQHAPLWSGNRKDSDWKPTGPIRKAKIGPGDNLEVSYNMGKMTWDVDKLGQADLQTNYWKNIDVMCIVRVRGSLGHDSGANILNVGWGEHRLDCMVTVSTRAFNNDGLGTDVLVYSQADDATNIADIEFVDDRGGALIQTAQV